MNTDLLEMFSATVGGPLIRQFSTYLGESEDTTRAAIHSVGPALLAGMMQRAAAPAGPGELFRAVTNDSVDTGISGKLAGMLVNRGTLGSLLSNGEAATGLIFGSRAAPLTNAIASASGVRPNSAMTLLSLGAPILLGMLKKLVANNDLDASALASLLFRQKNSLQRHGFDERISGALGFNLNTLPDSAAATAAPAQPARDKPWMPWAIAAGIAVVGVLFFVSRTAEHQDVPAGAVQVAEMPAEGGDRLRVAMADSTKVYFDTGDANIDSADREQIASVAQAARDTEREVTITGYTDHTGDQGTNEELAKNRAMAVREALVNEGVREDRIVMDPPRSVTGTGTDVEARRVDIDMN